MKGSKYLSRGRASSHSIIRAPAKAPNNGDDKDSLFFSSIQETQTQISSIIEKISSMVDKNGSVPYIEINVLPLLARFQKAAPKFIDCSKSYGEQFNSMKKTAEGTMIISTVSVHTPMVVFVQSWKSLKSFLLEINDPSKMPHAKQIPDKFSHIRQTLESILFAVDRNSYKREKLKRSIWSLESLCTNMSQAIIDMLVQDSFPDFTIDMFSLHKNNILAFLQVLHESFMNEIYHCGVPISDLNRMKQTVILDCNDIIECLKSSFTFKKDMNQIMGLSKKIDDFIDYFIAQFSFPNTVINPINEKRTSQVIPISIEKSITEEKTEIIVQKSIQDYQTELLIKLGIKTDSLTDETWKNAIQAVSGIITENVNNLRIISELSKENRSLKESLKDSEYLNHQIGESLKLESQRHRGVEDELKATITKHKNNHSQIMILTEKVRDQMGSGTNNKMIESIINEISHFVDIDDKQPNDITKLQRGVHKLTSAYSLVKEEFNSVFIELSKSTGKNIQSNSDIYDVFDQLMMIPIIDTKSTIELDLSNSSFYEIHSNPESERDLKLLRKFIITNIFDNKQSNNVISNSELVIEGFDILRKQKDQISNLNDSNNRNIRIIKDIRQSLSLSGEASSDEIINKISNLLSSISASKDEISELQYDIIGLHTRILGVAKKDLFGTPVSPIQTLILSSFQALDSIQNKLESTNVIEVNQS